jgi:hypothetical protein
MHGDLASVQGLVKYGYNSEAESYASWCSIQQENAWGSYNQLSWHASAYIEYALSDYSGLVSTSPGRTPYTVQTIQTRTNGLCASQINAYIGYNPIIDKVTNMKIYDIKGITKISKVPASPCVCAER